MHDQVCSFIVFKCLFSCWFLFVFKVLQDIMDDHESMDITSWNREMLHIFCDICIKTISMGMRPNTHFDRCGWQFILTSIKQQTSHAFSKTQLKNKWDACKKDWRIWTKVIAETGVGWSYKLGTIVASNEWWNSKIQVNFHQSNYSISFFMFC